MPYFYPLASFILPILAVYSVAKIYRSLYPYDYIRSALQILAEYRLLSRAKSKRLVKRARQMAPKVKAARRLLLRALLFKMLALIAVFMATTVLVFNNPTAFTPFDLPLFTLKVSQAGGGEVLVAYIPVVHLAGYIYALLLFREYLV